MFSVTLCERLISSTPSHIHSNNRQSVKISLFKDHLNSTVSPYPLLFAEVKKQSLALPQALDATEFSPEGVEDDEIISLNFDDQIPIEQEFSSSDFEPSNPDDSSDFSVASLPNEDISSEPQSIPEIDDTPWVSAKTKRTAKNRNLEHLVDNNKKNLFTENLQQLTQNDEAVSYKVAERIKQSIIFPIPDEILNDENLTPTFIKDKSSTPHKDARPSQKSNSSSATPPEVKKQDTTFKKVNPDTVSEEGATETDTSGILDSISSWFNTPKQEPTSNIVIKTQPIKKKKPAPTYGTDTANIQPKANSKTKQAELVDFYSSLQETRHEYTQRKIIPSELKLSFQPGKAEISGTTLTWLKAFSEATNNDDIYLQVKLDASAATELQKKRLNLLYTIFMNNGVDFKKVDTVFSRTEPNAFIIRTIRIK